MSSSGDISSSHRRRNTRRTCRTITKVLTELDPPDSGNNVSILHSDRTPESQNPTKSCGWRKTKKKREKPQAVNQTAPTDSPVCLKESTNQETGINGHVSLKSHEPESVVPQKNTIPKAKTSKRHYKGRKKVDTQPCEKGVDTTKVCSERVDKSTHSASPESHKTKRGTKRTHFQHSKKINTPSEVSTGLPTFTTKSHRPKKEISSCHTNYDCSSRPRTPKRGKLQPSHFLSSTPKSDLQPFSPNRAESSCSPDTLPRPQNVPTSPLRAPPPDATPSRRDKPQRLAKAGRPGGRRKGNVQEQSITSPKVKRCKKSAASPVECPQEEPSIEMPPGRPCLETQEPELQDLAIQNMSYDLSMELSLQEEPHPINESLLQEEDQDDDDEEEELPSFLQQDNKKPLSISEGLCVWFKLRKYPYWPAVVKSVNHKSKKASIVFIDGFLFDQKGIRKGFSVSMRTLKPFDCEESDKLVDIAKAMYGSAITWSLELISDYRIRIGCGSFTGSFIEYCAADISCPLRKKYSEGKSVLTFPSQEILSEQCNNSEENIEDIVVEEQDEHLSKKVLPDRSKAARNRANKLLVDFIVNKRKVENRLLAVISGQESSKWLQALMKPTRRVVDVYLEDEEQVDKVYRYLNKVCDNAPQINTCLVNMAADRICLILDVLLPEAIIHAIAGVHKLSLEKAEEKYRRGPCFSNRERREFDMMIEQHETEIAQRYQ
ncbi:PWWP domain-containing DNA repair factor 3B-like [Myxocyprinus asiaticus]|uniref:PWWP domain-containing DNA repair factor 3B-like n=1 Tax=Myxocyprinus asiaticus TaxID=70543 RepID=UPI0022214F6E|nr:PWWP domain-containing DNA repair factor 3B-like [Myxocyprinus asiaticus]XP_051554454.1 PWWP domain-containing DNA repair factor 3B-like [Myxocyprinus asiaticus]